MRMLITIFSIIFILGTQNVVYALATATTCGTKTSSTSCNATAGCYWNNGTCSPCPGGTYKGTTGESCSQCGENTEETQEGATDCKCKTGYERIDGFLDSSTDCTAKKYTLTYRCHDAQEIFIQKYADIKQPCIDDNTINSIYYEKNFKIPTFLTSKSGVSTDSVSQISRPKCLLSDASYNSTPQKECKKIGHNLIGWQTPEGKAILNIHGTNDKISEILNSYKEYEIIEAKTDSEIKYKWDKVINLYPIWAAEKITCDGGQYFSAESAKCTDCPEGFYCPGVTNKIFNNEDLELYQCPFGSTSDSKSDAITDCYLKPGKTVFLNESNAKFFMPASAEPAYYTNPTETSDE
ncbi:MAG: hypothetical protein R8M37_00640 [Alphaproteobacteria bacterium]|nr:hypothetical protein [Alphaproteobacteria bacterium]